MFNPITDPIRPLGERISDGLSRVVRSNIDFVGTT